jgi:ferredoxin-type protein NapH
MWFSKQELAFAVSIFFAGLSLGPCLGAYALARPVRKQTFRRAVLWAGGLSIVALSLLGAMNLDLEGFFMLLLAGTMGAAIGHTIITTVVGPMVFGRFLCGWGCWRSMVLESLPVGKGEGRRPGAWRWLPLLGLMVTAGAAVILVTVGHHPGGTLRAFHGGSRVAIAAGLGVYYVASISLAFALKDQRAFCKYLCPNSVILRQTSRLSLAKMEARADLCDGCGACSRVCPMDVDVAGFAQRGGRLRSGDCILCQRCAHVCPKQALRLSFGFGGRAASFGPGPRQGD